MRLNKRQEALAERGHEPDIFKRLVGMYEQRDGVLRLIATSDENGRFDPPVPLEAGIVYVKAYRYSHPTLGDQIRVLPVNVPSENPYDGISRAPFSLLPEWD